MPVVPRIEMPPTMPRRALSVFLAISTPCGTDKVMASPACSSSAPAAARTLLSMLRRGTGLMAGPPTSSPSPAMVTVPMPKPPRRHTTPGWPGRVHTSAVRWALSVQSGSSPASLMTMAWAVVPSQRPSWTAKRTASPLGSRQSTASGTVPCTRPCTAAAAAAAEHAPVVNPVRVPRRTVFSIMAVSALPAGVGLAPLLLLRLGQRQQRVQGSHDQRRAALAPANHQPGHFVLAGNQVFGFGGRDKAHRHPHNQRGAHTLLRNQPGQFDERRGRIANAHDGALQQAQAVGLAHGLHGAGGVLLLCQCDHIGIGNELVRAHAKVRQPWLRQARANHLHIGHHWRAATQHGGHARLHGLGVKVRQAVEVEVGIGVDHAPHDGPLLGRVGVALHLSVDDGKAVVLNGLPGAGELLGDGVDGAHAVSTPWLCGWCSPCAGAWLWPWSCWCRCTTASVAGAGAWVCSWLWPWPRSWA